MNDAISETEIAWTKYIDMHELIAAKTCEIDRMLRKIAASKTGDMTMMLEAQMQMQQLAQLTAIASNVAAEAHHAYQAAIRNLRQ